MSDPGGGFPAINCKTANVATRPADLAQLAHPTELHDFVKFRLEAVADATSTGKLPHLITSLTHERIDFSATDRPT